MLWNTVRTEIILTCKLQVNILSRSVSDSRNVRKFSLFHQLIYVSRNNSYEYISDLFDWWLMKYLFRLQLWILQSTEQVMYSALPSLQEKWRHLYLRLRINSKQTFLRTLHLVVKETAQIPPYPPYLCSVRRVFDTWHPYNLLWSRSRHLHLHHSMSRQYYPSQQVWHEILNLYHRFQ